MINGTTLHEGKVIIAGGGPVGLLTSLHLAIRLDADKKPLYPNIVVLEKRTDLRSKNEKEIYSKQEYNVVISHRGLQALSVIPGLLEVMMQEGVRYTRMKNCVRSDDIGRGFGVNVPGEKISIGRNQVVRVLLDFIQKHFNSQIEVVFEKAVVDIDFNSKRLYALPSFISRHPFEHASPSIIEAYNFACLIGTDGANSVVGEKLRKSVSEIGYSCQPHPEPYITAVIPHKVLESARIKFHPATLYTVQPSVGGVTLIALPNKDSLGVNLVFDPTKSKIKELFSGPICPLELHDFFRDSFPTLGEVLYDTFSKKFEIDSCRSSQKFKIPKNTFLTTKYSQFHHPSSPALLLGDAAHTMPPTVGQGINCGFSDAHYLSKALDLTKDDWSKAPALHNKERQPEAEAVQKLSEIYLGERGRFMFGLRLGLDIGRSILAKRLPSGWVQPTVNQLLSQTNVSYAKILQARQRHLITGCAIIISVFSSLGYLTFKAASAMSRFFT